MPHERPLEEDFALMSAMMNPQGAQSQALLKDNMSPRSKRLAMLQQKKFDEDDEEVKGSFSDFGEEVRMGGRMGSQIQSITNSKVGGVDQQRKMQVSKMPQQPQSMSGYDDDFARLDNDAQRLGGEDGEFAGKRGEDEDCSYNSMGEDLQLDESIQELKRISAVPQLKNTEKLSNKMSPDKNGSGSLFPLQKRLLAC